MIRLSEHDKIRLLHTAWRASSEDKHSLRMFKRGLVRIAVNYGDGSTLWVCLTSAPMGQTSGIA